MSINESKILKRTILQKQSLVSLTGLSLQMIIYTFYK